MVADVYERIVSSDALQCRCVEGHRMNKSLRLPDVATPPMIETT